MAANAPCASMSSHWFVGYGPCAHAAPSGCRSSRCALDHRRGVREQLADAPQTQTSADRSSTSPRDDEHDRRTFEHHARDHDDNNLPAHGRDHHRSRRRPPPPTTALRAIAGHAALRHRIGRTGDHRRGRRLRHASRDAHRVRTRGVGGGRRCSGRGPRTSAATASRRRARSAKATAARRAARTASTSCSA